MRVRSVLGILPILLLLGSRLPCSAQQVAQSPSPPLKQLSIEELLDVDVSLPLGRDERVMEAPSAISVVTSEDLRRNGAVSLPEALRTIPGLFVARFNASSWIVTSRGFASNSANKMLVMIDGRSVYTPLFSGVFWEQQDAMLFDLDRIEVIRGPGAALWGSNAVNGVISVVSKRASETQGTLIAVGGGIEERFNTSVRHGGRVGAGYFRVYGKVFDRDAADVAGDQDARDGQRFGQGGFRMDFGPSDRAFTLQGDTYVSNIELADRNDIRVDGQNVLARWTRRPSTTSDLQVQTYYDRTYRNVPLQFQEQRHTLDVDVQHRWSPNTVHGLSAGGGYRYTRGNTEPTALLFFDPEDRATTLVSGFVQDEIRWTSAFSTIAGLKIERNDYTGVEWQPTARVRWTPSRAHTLWGAVSRAIRMPTRLDTDLRILQNGVVVLAGTSDFKSEIVVAFEAGYRSSPVPTFAWSIEAFRNHYDDLRTSEPSAVPPPVRIGNGLNADISGITAAMTVQPRPWVRLTGGYSYLHHDLSLDPTSRDLGRGLLETIDPTHQAHMLARLDLPHGLEVDTSTRHVSELPAPGTPPYTEAGFRVGWRVTPRLEIALIGRDILHDDHLEFVSPTSTRQTHLERTLFTRALLSF